MAKLLIRNYTPGDETGIVRLFNSVFAHTIDVGYWNWKFRDNPFGPPRTSVVVDEDRIVGHFSLNPVPVWFNKREVLAAQGVDFMIDPSYREHGIGSEAAQFVVDQIEEAADISFSFVFPMPRIQKYTQRTLGYENVIQVSSVVRPLRFTSLFRPVLQKIPGLSAVWRRHDCFDSHGSSGATEDWLQDSEVRKIRTMDSRFDRLWDDTKADYGIAVVRNSTYLNWRYSRPGYTIYALFNHDDLLGFVVLSERVSDGWRIGYIADLWTRRNEATKPLIRAAVLHFRSRRVDVVRCWMAPDHPHYRGLREQWFLPRTVPDRLMVRPYGSLVSKSVLLDGQNWYLTLGDSDGA